MGQTPYLGQLPGVCVPKDVKYVPAHESPWKEGGYPLFAMAFPLAVTTAAAFGRSEPDGFVVPQLIIYSRN